MKPTRLILSTAITAAVMALIHSPAEAQTFANNVFVNGLTIPGSTLDLSSGSDVDRRVGFFSDLYYDSYRNEWWGLSDRGPGGGTLSYETRLQRFTIDVNSTTGAISNFQIAETIKFTLGGNPLNGLAPSPSNLLGNSFDPEGFVVNPVTGTFLVSDEYGPSVYEIGRDGAVIRQFTTPSNLVPMAGANVDYNANPQATANPQQTAGRQGNRGMEGLAISPDGLYAYGMLQNGTVTDGYNPTTDTRGIYTRIVKYDIATGAAVAQYAYRLESSGQGRGISAIVALGNDKFLVLERNNRGIGIGATLASPDKNVFIVDLAGASDVTGINLPATGNLPSGLTPVNKGAKVMDLDANLLAALGNKSPEKWEGLAIGPQLSNGKYVVLAGTDNDYSVTQNGTGTQFDVYMDFNAADPFATAVQVPIGTTAGVPNGYSLLPGVLHAYTADVTGYVTPVPEPTSVALLACGAGLLGFRRRRA